MSLICALLLAGGQAAVPPAPPAPVTAVAPDPARLVAARALIAVMNFDAQLDRIFVQLSPMFAQTVIGALAQDEATRPVVTAANARPDGNARMIAILSQEFMTALRKHYPAIKEETAAEYARAFDGEELAALSAFYASGAGAKALRLMPELQAKLGAKGQGFGREAGLEAGQRAMERIAREVLEQDERPRT